MSKKLPFLALLLLIGVGLILKTSIKQKTSIDKLREQHAKFLKDHPYQEIGKLSKKERKSQGLPPNAYFEQKYLSEINPYTGKTSKESLFKLQKELEKTRAQLRAPGDVDNAWVERGPDNVGGRTRAVIFDPNDTSNETVFAGGVSGGLWKNTNISNANSQWVRVGIPENLAVSCIAVDPNNSQIFYVGTGESYVNGDVNGDGLWKSIDGGSSWSKVFGGVTGNTFFDANSKLTVNSPVGISGDYDTVLTSNFGGDITSPITQDLILVDDGTGTLEDGCEAITNTITGKIAVIRRGGCNFTAKVLNAQNAGAIAVIMVNNISGNPFSMGGADAAVTIPAVMISKESGDAIINALSSGTVNGTLTKTSNTAVGADLVPGIQHINDVVVRNNGGSSEVFVAVGESGYTGGVSLGGDSFGVYKSTDGTTFNKLTMPQTAAGNEHEPSNLEVAADNSIYMSTTSSYAYGDGGGVIMKSTDGTTFTIVHTITDGLRTEISASGTNAGTVYVLAEINNTSAPVSIYKTTNSFGTVSSISLPRDADTGISNSDFTRGQAFYDLLIKVDPNNDNTVYVGGIDLFKSTNSGGRWTQLSHWYGGFRLQEVHSDQHGLAFANSNRMVFSNDGGVYFSNDAGGTIAARNSNYNTMQFYTVGVAPTTAFGGNEYFLAGSQDNGTQLVENGNAGINSSTEATGGDGAASFFDTDGSDQYFISNYVFNQSIRLYNYATSSWTTVNSESTSNGDFINQEELDSNLNILYSNYSSTSGNSIKRYSNLLGTISKTDLTDALMTSGASALKISPYTLGSSKLFVGLKGSKVLKVENANTGSPTWTDISGSEFIGSVSDIEFGVNESEIFVTMHNYGVVNIWYTNDGGTTWNNKEGNLPDLPVKSILQNPLNTEEVIIGTDLGVWKTTNFSNTTPTWTQAYNGMSNVPVLDLDLRDDNVVFAATYGRGVFSGQFTASTASNDIVEEKEIEKLSLYPTISGGEFTLHAKANSGKSKIDIYNVNGQQVYSTKVDFSNNEKQDLSVNLQAGMYIVNVIDSNNKKSSKKFIIK